MSATVQSITFKALQLTQPVGSFYIARIGYKDLRRVSVADVRRLERERDFEKYLGIQRPLSTARAKEIRDYALTIDATFPTSIIIAVSGKCAKWDEKAGELTIKEYLDGSGEPGDEIIPFENIANILDGQHRIAGLMDLHTLEFDLSVAVFVDIDISQQAYIFSTVNLTQTKVNRSLVYDLFALSKSRSPQRTCHTIAVALDQSRESPFFQKIKRLGVATDGRFDETLTQSTFVEAFLPYISRSPMQDRDLLLTGKALKRADEDEARRLIFRNMFIDEKDVDITKIILNYFTAIETKWAKAWGRVEAGNIINRTNGFRAFARFLRPAYASIVRQIGEVPTVQQFDGIFEQVTLGDADFSTGVFLPGTSGESALLNRLLTDSKLSK